MGQEFLPQSFMYIGRNLGVYAGPLEHPAQLFGTIAGPVIQFGEFNVVACTNAANPAGAVTQLNVPHRPPSTCSEPSTAAIYGSRRPRAFTPAGRFSILCVPSFV